MRLARDCGDERSSCNTTREPYSRESAMQIQIPTLYGTQCTSLTVCGRVRNPTKEFKSRLAETDDMIARYGSGKTTSYVRVLTGGKSGKHLHVDCAVRGFFPENRTPKTSHKKADVVSFLNGAEGQELDAGIMAYFTLNIRDLPEQGLVRSMQLKKRTGGIEIEVTSAELAIDGPPLESILWRVRASEKKVLVRLIANKPTTVSDNYLANALEWITQQLRLYVFGERADATD